MIDRKEIGRQSRKKGKDFEKRVRTYLEKENWIVDRWANNVEDGKLIASRPKFIYNPIIKRRIPIGLQSGFPDYIAFQHMVNENHEALFGILDGPIKKIRLSGIIGVEAKMTGILTRIEKDKCIWLLKNNIFSDIYIAMKGNKRGEILMKRFVEHEKM